MSLLDDVSIVVTPNGYKAGELYAVVPVPTEGTELITNGTFDTDSDWTKTSQVTINNGVANILSNDGSFQMLGQNNVVTIGKSYVLTYTIVSANNGSLKLNTFGQINSTVGTHKFYFVATETPLNIARNSGITDISIDNVSVKEYTSADMDVTRATAATRVDEDGLVNYAEVIGSDLVTNGSFTTDTDWDKTGTWSIESNYATASGNSTSQYIQQDFTITNGKTYLFTYEIIENTLNGNGSSLSGSGGFVSVSLSSVIGTHQVYITADDSGAVYALKIGVSGTATTGTIKLDNVSVKEVTRDNVPRIDYTGGGCPHILAEPQRTNLITYSEDFSQWIEVGSPTLTPDYGLSPDGTENSTRIELSTNARIYTSLSASGDIAFSVYLKGSGVITLRDNTNAYRQDVTLTSEWARYDLYFNATITNVQIQNQTASAVDCELWGAQLEEGSYATSYIPTEGSTVTRNQDIFTRDGIGSLINSTEGCVFGEGNFAESNSSIYNYFVSLSDGTPNNRLEIRQSVSNLQFLWRVATYQSEISTSSLDVSGNFKFALNYSAANIKFYVNGNLIGTINTPTLWSANTLNRLAFDNGAGGDRLSGKVKQLQVYNTALTDEQLLQLTGESGTDFYESYAEMATALTYTIQ